ncbi:phosphotransferase [Streptomyces sp. NPDC048182]|uniref:phosphotransferase n=1 Tax=Streptomyces sp. NPDC048182 TaxID=3365507 RepID=UPI0037195604
MSGDSSAVRGPLKGYHHETYVLSPPGGIGRVKLRSPRATAEWFDRRCFASEEELLRGLGGRVEQVPEVVDVEGLGMQRFIEGRTLGAHWWWGRRVPEPVLAQIVRLFGQLVPITAETLHVDRRCSPLDAPDDKDTDGFLERLVAFAEEQVWGRYRDRFGTLFGELGVGDESFAHLRKNVLGLAPRPFCLLHADLHRENFVIDPRGRLWTIDWELAMVGDPLYDLATHLYLMRYPAGQRDRVIADWRDTVEAVRPGSARGLDHDLGPLLDFKRAQSVYTDVVRVALSLRDRGAAPRWPSLPRAAGRLHRALAAAAVPMGLTDVPEPQRIGDALARWCRADAAGRGGA